MNQQEILAQAAEWLLKIRSGELSQQQLQELEQWKHSSPAHEKAWRKAEKLLNVLNDVPQNSDAILQHGQQHSRKILGKLVLSLLFASTAIYFWQDNWYYRLFADYYTARGEQQQILLEDGTQLDLNTSTALDVQYTAQQRSIHLHYGEIWIKTGHLAAYKDQPFIVTTKYADIQALGTVFSVQQLQKQQQSCVAVLESAVKITLKDSHTPQIVHAGKQLCFDARQSFGKQPVQPNQYLWRNHVIMAYDMPLKTLIQQIGRYQNRYFRLAPEIENIKVSGSFPLHDLDQLIQALQQSYPVDAQTYFDQRLVVIKARTSHQQIQKNQRDVED